jgi:hypothetical protein
MQAQERSSLRGLTRTFGVSRTTVSNWIKKKELSFLPDRSPCLHRIPKIPLLRPWNWTSSGRWCSKKHTTLGCGLPSAARRDRWSLMPWVIGACRTCQRLWEAIAQGYRQGHGFTDFWAAYAAVIPEEQHTAVGPRDGRNGPRGAMEQHLAPTSGSFCAHDVVLFQVGDHA